MRPDVDGLLPVFVIDDYEGYGCRRCRTPVASSSTRGSRRMPPRSASCCPADIVVADHVVLGGPVAAATGARYSVLAHGSELEYSMRGNEELSRWGGEVLARRARR